MGKKIKISWSGFDRWMKCPQMFNLYHLQKEGFELDHQQNRANAVFGSVIQEVFTRFFNDQLWKEKNCLEFCQADLLPKIWDYVLKDIQVDWQQANLDSTIIFNELKENITKVIQFLEAQHFLKENYFHRSEVKLSKRISGDYFLVGKLDFLLTIGSERILLDGKATFDVDFNQLYFYAILHKQIFGKYPTKLGFLFYKEPLIKFIDLDLEKIQQLELEIRNLIQTIEQNHFPAQPTIEKCDLCLFKEKCTFSAVKKTSNM